MQAISCKLLKADDRSTAEVVDDLRAFLDTGVPHGPSLFIESLGLRIYEACPNLVAHAYRQLPKNRVWCLWLKASDVHLGVPWDAQIAYLTCVMSQETNEGLMDDVQEIAGVVGDMRKLRLALMPYIWEIKRIASAALDRPQTGARFQRQYCKFMHELG